MKIDELGMYYIKADLDDEENVLQDCCNQCEEEFTQEEKVYMTQQFTDEKHNFIELCRECMRSMKVANQL